MNVVAIVDDKPTSSLATLDISSYLAIVENKIVGYEDCHFIMARLVDYHTINTIVIANVVV